MFEKFFHTKESKEQKQEIPSPAELRRRNQEFRERLTQLARQREDINRQLKALELEQEDFEADKKQATTERTLLDVYADKGKLWKQADRNQRDAEALLEKMHLDDEALKRLRGDGRGSARSAR